jgi:hypothetical protein
MALDLRARTEGWELVIAGARGAVRHVLDLCRVSDRVRTVDDPADAGAS